MAAEHRWYIEDRITGTDFGSYASLRHARTALDFQLKTVDIDLWNRLDASPGLGLQDLWGAGNYSAVLGRNYSYEIKFRL